MQIEWIQVLVAFFLGVLASAAVKGFAGSLRSKVGG
jgi:hypothetical protein